MDKAHSTTPHYAEEALWSDQRFIQQIAAAIPDLLYIYDLVAERNIYINHAVTSILGYSAAEIHAMGPALMPNLLHPHDIPQAENLRHWFCTAQDGDILTHEVRMQHATGEWRWLALRETVFARDAHGLPTQVLGIAQDITERKQAEEAYRILVENSLQGLMIMQDGCNVFVNPAAARITGYSAEELLAMSATEVEAILHPHDHALVVQRGLDCIMGNTISSSYTFRIIRNDGAIRWIEASAIRIEYRGRPALQITSLDITEHKRAEEELVKFQRAVEQSSSSIIITRRDGGIEYVNPRFSRLTGYTLDEVRGRNPRLLKSGRTPQHVYDELWSTVTAGSEWRGEFCNRKKDGEAYWESASISPIVNEGGEITHFVAVKEDITRRKHMEDALRESQILLQSIVDNVPAIINARDFTGRYILANRAAAEVLGLLPEQIVGHHFSEVVPAELVATFQAADDHIKATSEVVYEEVVLPSSNGTGMETYLAYSFPLYDDREHLFGISTIATDITDRKRMEQELHASKTRLQAVLDNAAVGIGVTNTSGTLIYINEHGAQQLGYTPEELMHISNVDLTHPDDRATTCEYLRALLANEITSYRIEKRYLRKDGTVFWSDLSVTPVRKAQGAIEALIGIVVDITDRKRMEDELRALNTSLERLVEERTADLSRSEARSQALLNAMPDSMFWFCRNGDILGFKANESVNISISPEQLIGSNLYNIMPPDFCMLCHAYSERVLATGAIQMFEYELHGTSGVHDLETRLVVCETDQILAVVRDITERKRAERVLQESEARYRTLIETSPNAVLMTDLDGTIRFCNRQAVALFGYSSSRALLAQPGSSLLPAELFPGSAQHKDDMVATVQNRECTLRRKDGSYFPAELNSAVVTNTHDDPTALIIVVRNISEQKQLQAQIIASERFAIGGRLAASVAHEINTPLQALENFLNLVQVAPESDRQPFLQSAQQEVQRVARIVGQLLDIYRPQAATPGAVALTTLIERLLLLLGKHIKEQKVAVALDMGTDVPPIWGRADEVTQVLLNIMMNALDVMPSGGTLGVRQWQSDNHVHLAISDTGDGIASHWLDHIFEPFVTTKEQGVGLGLAISYQIVQQYGGQILVESTPGKGSTFTVIFPQAPWEGR